MPLTYTQGCIFLSAHFKSWKTLTEGRTSANVVMTESVQLHFVKEPVRHTARDKHLSPAYSAYSHAFGFVCSCVAPCG